MSDIHGSRPGEALGIMARSRNLKPGLFKNEILGIADPIYTLAFEGLWLLADREGRLEDRPLRIKAETFPYRDQIDMDSILNWLQEKGFILRYKALGKQYIQVLNFQKHQNPHKNETESEIPSTDEIRSPPEKIGTHSEEIGSTPADSLLLIPDSLNPITTTSPAGDPLACPVEEICSIYHEAMPMNPRCKVLNISRRGAIKARWLEASRLRCEPFGYANRAEGLAAWREFFEICNESLFLTGRADAQPGKPPFFADLDFLMSPGGFVKCLENKYHREVT